MRVTRRKWADTAAARLTIKKFIGYEPNSVISAKIDAAIASLRELQAIREAGKDMPMTTAADIRKRATEIYDAIYNLSNHRKVIDAMLQFADERVKAERERCAKVCRKRAEERFAEYGITESDTNASYYVGRRGDILAELDEEDDACAEAIERGSEG